MIVLTHSLRSDAPTKEYDGARGAIDWLSDTVVHPLVNSALIEPCNTVSHLLEDASGKHLSLGELKPLAQNKAPTYSTSWFVESAMSGVGSLVPFVLSGMAAKGAMRGAASTFGIEGRAASVLTSNRFAQLTGAGIYAGMKRPEPGESRLGNAAGTVAAFALFDAGNSLATLPMFNKSEAVSIAARSTLRIGTGFAGGAMQSELASIVSQHKLANNDQVIQSGVGGAFLNFPLGSLHDWARSDLSNTAKLPEQQSRDLLSDASKAGKSAELSKAKSGLLSDIPAALNIAEFANRKSVLNTASADGRSSVVYIVVDSGFAPESLPAKENILGVWDPTGEGVFNDPLHHGSVVLGKLVEGDPSAKFMLIKAYDGSNNLAQTKFENGQISRSGWTEAYLEAVSLADKLKLPSVANCSFGEFTHAMDGTGWESNQLSKSTGHGKPGHVVVAASGPGNGAARHASGTVEAGRTGKVNISQNGEVAFNLWMGKDAPKDWNLAVYEGDSKIHSVNGAQLEPNFWNNRQQITFKMQLEGAASRFVLHARVPTLALYLLITGYKKAMLNFLTT